jgi:hypothetical protein
VVAAQHFGPAIWRMASVILAVGIGFQLLRLWLKSRRTRVYTQLCRVLPLHACKPGRGVSVPELAAVTQHARGKWKGYKVHVFENVSDVVESGAPTATQTCILLTKRNWNLPVFTIEPRSMATSLRQHVDKNKGLFFPKDEVFTTTCFVDGPDREAVQRTLTVEATRHLRNNKHVHVESRGHVLLVYKSETLLSARSTLNLLELAIGFADGLAKP